MPKVKKKLVPRPFYKQLGWRQLSAVIVIIGCAAVGAYLLKSSHAATPIASTVEAEAGQLGGNASLVTGDSTASGSGAVRFGTTATTTSSYGITQVVNFMTKANTVFPYNIPTDYSWQPGPQYNSLAPSGFSAATAWGWIFPANAAANTPPANVSIQIRNIYIALYLKSTASWKIIQSENTPATEWDAITTGDYVSNPTSSQYSDQSTANGGGLSFIPQTGLALQLYPDNTRGTYTNGDEEAVYTEYQARVIKTNSSGPDNTAQAHYVAQSGGDWWPNTTAQYPANVGIFSGGFAPIPDDGSWATFSAWSGPNGLQAWQNSSDANGSSGWSVAQLEANPPPINALGN